MPEPAAGSADPATTWLLRDRRFGPYVITSTLSNIGTWFQDIATAILVFDLTGSATWVGAVTFSSFAAVFLLAPVTGSMADRFDRRRLLAASQYFQLVPAVALAGLTMVGLTTPWPLLSLALVTSVGKALAAPTMQALIPSIVSRRDLPAALALQSVSFNLSRAVGPLLGALVVAASGVSVAFVVNSLSFFPFLVVLVRLRADPSPRQPEGMDRRLRVAVRHVVAHRGQAYLLLSIAVLGGAMEPVNTLAPSWAATFDAGDAGVGYLVSAFGVGSILMAVPVSRLRRWLAVGRAGTVGVLLQATGLAVLAVAPRLSIALGGLAVAGAGYLLGQTDVTTQLQEAVPDHMRGRVMALWSLGFLGSRPLAALVVGWLADQTSVRMATLGAAAVALSTIGLPRRAAVLLAAEDDAIRT